MNNIGTDQERCDRPVKILGNIEGPLRPRVSLFRLCLQAHMGDRGKGRLHDRE